MTLKELIKQTGAPEYTIQYLRKNGRLKMISDDVGSGRNAEYHPDCVEIVKQHMGGKNGLLS